MRRQPSNKKAWRQEDIEAVFDDTCQPTRRVQAFGSSRIKYHVVDASTTIFVSCREEIRHDITFLAVQRRGRSSSNRIVYLRPLNDVAFTWYLGKGISKPLCNTNNLSSTKHTYEVVQEDSPCLARSSMEGAKNLDNSGA